MALIWITKAEYVKDFKVALTFNDGIYGTVDLKDHLDGEVFKPLRNIEFFMNFKLDNWTLTWSNESDFAPEFLYELVLSQKVKTHNTHKTP